MTPDFSDPFRRFRHDLANPLAALLAEVQLLLLDNRQLDAETLKSLKEIEQLALRMRVILRQSGADAGDTIG